MKNYGKNYKAAQTKKGPETCMSDGLVKCDLFATLRIVSRLWKHMKILLETQHLAPSTAPFPNERPSSKVNSFSKMFKVLEILLRVGSNTVYELLQIGLFC